MDTHSKLTLDGVGWRFRKNTKVPSECQHQNCPFEIQRFFSKIDLSEGSKLTLENIHIEKFGNNTIHAKDSEVIAKIQRLQAGIWKRIFHQFGWGMSSGSLKTVKLSYLPVLESVLTIMFNSIRIRIIWPPSIPYNSMIRAHQATFTEFLCVYEESFASLTGETTFLSENAQTISFGVLMSVLMAEHMICHKIADPNIRLKVEPLWRRAPWPIARAMRVIWPKEIEDDCDYLVGREVAKGNAQVVPTGQATDATVAPTTARDSGPEKNKMLFKNSIAWLVLKSQTWDQENDQHGGI